jgi:serpin B
VSSLAVFEEELTGVQVQDIIAELTPTQVALTLPKWSFESQTNLVEPLSTLGMPDAFNPSQADFSGMDGSRDISLTGVFHKAFVAVDEQGTEAAAATGVVAGVTSVQPAEPVVMRVDRPFLFLIRDRETGAVLFVGRVVNPST